MSDFRIPGFQGRKDAMNGADGLRNTLSQKFSSFFIHSALKLVEMPHSDVSYQEKHYHD
jgi:hypothetical protein